MGHRTFRLPMPRSLLLLVLAFTLPAAAQGTFTSAQSGQWNVASTWTLTSGTDADGLPDADDTVTILTGHTVNPYGIGTDGVAALTVEAGGGLLEQSGLSIEVLVKGPFVNRGTVAGGLYVHLGGDLTNEGTWEPWGTRLVATSAQTLTFAPGTVLVGRLTDLDPTSPTLAGSDLTFDGSPNGKPFELRGADLRVGTHTLTVRAGASLSSDGPGADDGALVFEPGGRLVMSHADPYRSNLVNIRLEGPAELAGTVDVRENVVLDGPTTLADGAVLAGSPGSTFDLAVEGDFVNLGTVGGGLVVRLRGDLTSSGVWSPNQTRFVGAVAQTLTFPDAAALQGTVLDDDASSPLIAGSDLTFDHPQPATVELRGSDLVMGPYRLTITSKNGISSDGPGADDGAVTFSEGGRLRMLNDDPYTSSLLNVRIEGATLEGTVHIRENVVFDGVTTITTGSRIANSPGAGFVLTVEGDLVNDGAIGPVESFTVAGDFTLGAGSTIEAIHYAFQNRIDGRLVTLADDPGDPETWPSLRDLGEFRIGGLYINGLRLIGTWLRVEGEEPLTQFDHVLFEDVPTNVTQLLIRHPGLPGGQIYAEPGRPENRFVVNDVTFRPLADYPGGLGSHDPGLYAAAVDTAPDDENELAIEIRDSSTGGGAFGYTDDTWEGTAYGYFVGQNTFWPEVERAEIVAAFERVEFGLPGEPATLGYRTLSVESPGEITVERSPEATPVMTVCFPFGPTGLEICQDIDVQAGTVKIRVGSNVVSEARVDLPLVQNVPPGKIPSLMAIDPTGNLTTIGGNIIAAGGGNIIAAGGGNIIAAGGGNIIAAGGGNIIAAGGGNIIAAGGGNLTAAPLANVLPQGVTASLRGATGGGDDDGLTLFVAFLPEVRLDAHILIDGALADGAGLRTDLLDGGFLPLRQPYANEPLLATAKGLPDATVLTPSFLDGRDDLVDWVVVELRHPEGGAVRRTALLRADGQIVDFDSSTVAFRGIPPGEYTVAVYHRNHAAAVTAAPVSFAAGEAAVVDFTAPDVAEAGSQREVAPGVFAQRGGDVDADGAVTEADLDPAFALALDRDGYAQADLDLDGRVSALDAHRVLLPTLGRVRPGNAPAPGALDARLRYTTSPDDDIATVALQLRGDGPLGTSTFQFRYDPAVLELLGGKGLLYTGEQPATDGGTAVYAEASGVTSPDTGEVSVNVVLAGEGPGRVLPSDYADVARVRFRVLDPQASLGLAWSFIDAYDGYGGLAGAYATGTADVVDGGIAVAGEAPLPETVALLSLGAPYPNPVRGQARIPYAVPESGRVRMAAYDALGREVSVLVDGERGTGTHAATLDTGALTPGVYVLRLESEAGVVTRRLTVVR